MTTCQTPAPLGPNPLDALDALERLAVGSVAAPSLALARSGVVLTFAQWRARGSGVQGDPATVGEVADRIGSAASAPAG